MSLKSFHIVFVVATVALAVGFGVWALQDYRVSGESASLVIGIGSLVGACLAVLYGRWFLRKLQGVGYL